MSAGVLRRTASAGHIVCSHRGAEAIDRRALRSVPSSSAARRRHLRRHDNIDPVPPVAGPWADGQEPRQVGGDGNLVPYLPPFSPPSLGFECVAPPGNPKPFRKFGAAPRKLTYFD